MKEQSVTLQVADLTQGGGGQQSCRLCLPHTVLELGTRDAGSLNESFFFFFPLFMAKLFFLFFFFSLVKAGALGLCSFCLFCYFFQACDLLFLLLFGKETVKASHCVYFMQVPFLKCKVQGFKLFLFIYNNNFISGLFGSIEAVISN